jgi:aminomethyltransferase
MNRTPLFDEHCALAAKMAEFAGWQMPINYGSQIAEHRAVRRAAGMFDVSHMTVIDVGGRQAKAFLRRVVANDVDKLIVGRALYGAMLNEGGGIVDDLIVYRREAGYRTVVNAATRVKVLDWLSRHRVEFEVTLTERDDLALVAVQGPRARDMVRSVTGYDELDALAPFAAFERGEWMIGRTGYTGEDGVEIILPNGAAPDLWRKLLRAGVVPAGLGARDTLRLEAGLNLYGQDMDETTSPLVSNMAWTVAWDPDDRAFIGRAALARERDAGPSTKLTGVVMQGRGVMRHDQVISTGAGAGVVTSGIFSPTLGYSIAFARLPRAAAGECKIEIRGKTQRGRIVKPPFVRAGIKVFQ